MSRWSWRHAREQPGGFASTEAPTAGAHNFQWRSTVSSSRPAVGRQASACPSSPVLSLQLRQGYLVVRARDVHRYRVHGEHAQNEVQ